MDAEIKYKLVDYFKSGHCANMMESNKFSIHIASGDIIVDGNGTDQSIYELLALHLDENNKLSRSILRYGGTMENYRSVFIPSMPDTKDQWELDIDQFPYSDFFWHNTIGDVSTVKILYCIDIPRPQTTMF